MAANRRKKRCRSALLAAVHETAEGLRGAGVMSKRKMRQFDRLCLTPVLSGRAAGARP
jgi:putative transcriptional regulator